MRATLVFVYLALVWLTYGLFIADQLSQPFQPETANPNNH
ncbi:hypothetical protein NIES25_70050 (plasmid) [Nostoc linckia NIES-25]|nr:hypothetical protein NIES25_70050 [Nostoc linckia NIES-25]